MIAIAGAAPALALSPCPTPVAATLAWTGAGFTRVSSTSASSTSGALSVTVTASVLGAMTVDATNNLNTRLPPNGGGTWTGLFLHDRSRATNDTLGVYADRQDVLFAFNKTIMSISFTVADIDSQGTAGAGQNHYIDAVAITPPMTGVFPAGASTVVMGAGTPANPWKDKRTPSGTATLVPDTSNVGNVDVTYAPSSGFSSFTLAYWNVHPDLNGQFDGSLSSQGVWLTPFSVMYCP